MIIDKDEEVVRAHCLAEREARRRWAEAVTDEWMAKASMMSLKMVDEALNTPLEDQADGLFWYWKMRTEATQGGHPIDREALRQWDAVVAGEDFEGNYNFWQRSAPVASEVSALPC